MASVGRFKMQSAPAADRNKGPILEVLQQYIPEDLQGFVLEVASGTGQHVIHFASKFRNLTWQPSDCDDQSLQSIWAYIKHSELPNVKPPLVINCTQPPQEWANGQLAPESCDVIYNSNMVHISPWATSMGFFRGIQYLLRPGGYLFMYGPYAINGVITPDSNVEFDKSLKARNPEWGLRDLCDIKKLAEEAEVDLLKVVDMPANNKTLVFKRKSLGP